MNPYTAAFATFIYLQNVAFQIQSLQSEFDALPAVMNWAKEEIGSLELLLNRLNDICLTAHQDLVRKNDSDSVKVLRFCDKISKSMLDLVKVLASMQNIPPPAFLDDLWNTLFSLESEWQKKKSQVIRGIAIMKDNLSLLSQIVVADTARKTYEIYEKVLDLERKLDESLTPSERPQLQRSRNRDRVEAFDIEDMCTELADICQGDHTCSWYRLQNSGSAIIVRDAKGQKGILGFLVWNWGVRDKLPQIYKVKERLSFQSYPSGKMCQTVEVFSEADSGNHRETIQVPLTFENVNDAMTMRSSLERCSIESIAPLWQVYKRNKTEFKQPLRESRKIDKCYYIAEIFRIRIDNREQRVLQLWFFKNGKFDAKKEDRVYLHERSTKQSYVCQGSSLTLHNSTLIETPEGLGYLRDNYENAKDTRRLEGDFVLRFTSDEDTKKFYDLLISTSDSGQTSSDEE